MSERSEREREEARLERERRRAAGHKPPPEPPAPPPPPKPAVAPPARPPTAPRPAAAPGPQPGAPGMPRHPLSIPPRRRRRPAGRVAALGALLALFAGLLGFLAFSVFTPLKGDGHGRVVVAVPQGSSARQVGDLLAARGVVGSGLFFSLRAALAGKRDKLRSGRFELRRDMSNGAAIAALTKVPAIPPVRDVLIPEGPGRREVARLAAAAGVPGDYLAASVRSDALNPRRYGAPRGTPSLEGFLFPATYRLRRAAGVRTLVDQQLAAFRSSIRGVSMRYARSKQLTTYDVLIVASMVEREAAVARDRRLIASVIFNRLRRRMPLGIDATTRYAENNWTRPLTAGELKRPGAFNTRLRTGLPPTPIGNPGLASIRAAADPARTGFLYYVVRPCGNGAHAFSSTDAQFQRDVAAYQRKRAELGGKDPSTCPK